MATAKVEETSDNQVKEETGPQWRSLSRPTRWDPSFCSSLAVLLWQPWSGCWVPASLAPRGLWALGEQWLCFFRYCFPCSAEHAASWRAVLSKRLSNWIRPNGGWRGYYSGPKMWSQHFSFKTRLPFYTFTLKSSLCCYRGGIRGSRNSAHLLKVMRLEMSLSRWSPGLFQTIPLPPEPRAGPEKEEGSLARANYPKNADVGSRCVGGKGGLNVDLLSFHLQFLKNPSVFLVGFSVIHFCSHLPYYLFT